MLVIARLLLNLYRLLTWPLWALLRRARRGPRWVELVLHGGVDELAVSPPSGLRGLLARLRPASVSVAEVRQLAERLAADTRAEGLLVSLSGLRAGYATLAALREVFAELVARGKRVALILPEGGAQQELFVASAASLVAAPVSASFSLLGPLASRRYVAPLLAKLGLQVEVVAQGRYKTAAEALVREGMSDAEREQATALVETLKATLTSGLAARAGDATEALFDQALFGVDQAQQAGLVDQIAYRDEFEQQLGLGDKERPASHRTYLRRTRPRRLVPLRAPAKFALLHLAGPIGEVSSARSIGLKATYGALRALAERRDVLGVILHLDTPGGSATVSDLLHHEVQRLGRDKPVVAWMGDVAASGGYYLAAAAQRIVARDCTITGSIGVISAHLVAAELLARAGVRSDVVKRTPHADLASIARPLGDDERALLDAQSRAFYARFLQVVAEGRHMSVAQAAELAQGRVWSGRDAQRVGLVDVLGGYATARDELRTLLGDKASQVAWETPVVVAPQQQRGQLWGGVSMLRELVLAGGSDPAQVCAFDLAELSLRHGSLLAYAWDAQLTP
ncbi:MAG TPA: signal peptide peptidase SppA [Polyangiales bacterium]